MSDVDSTDVLQFWFHGDQRENYKDKWFPSQGQAQTAIDKVIFERFHSTLNDALVGKLQSWKTTRLAFVALIVVLDQFSRHIYRHLELPSDAVERQEADALALAAAEELSAQIQSTYPVDVQGGLTMAQYIFSMMPYRHTATEERLISLLSNMEVCSSQFAWESELLNRFRKQTTRRLQHIQDRSRAEEADSILEHEFFDVKTKGQDVVKQMMKNNLVGAVARFLDEHNKSASGAPVAISLSGGVDSMVIAKILQLLCGAGGRIPCEVVAMHIDYANRNESAEEADYVDWYCRELGITFLKRVVNEVTRGVTDRTEYERITREIRYSFYRDVLSERGCQGVIFGHHQGDVQENVISNLMRGSSCLQLSGMESVGVSSGVPVWRPLLKFCKDDIYAFAHAYGVPYFRDTTPSWSTRGKLRNQLVPLLVDMYGAGCLTSLSSLASESDVTRALVEKNVYAPLLDSVRRHACGLVVNILPFVHQPQCFWREMLKQLMHSMGMAMVRDKAVGIFVERLQFCLKDRRAAPQKAEPERKTVGLSAFGWLELRKHFHVELSERGDLTIFREEVFQSLPADFRVQIADIHQEESKDCFTKGLVLVSGAWTISLSWLPVPHEGSSQRKRILQTPQDLLSGHFSYVLDVLPGCDALELLTARVGGRKTGAGKPPHSLIGIDLRLRNGLPILVPSAQEESGDDTATALPRMLLLDYRFRQM